MVSIDRDRGILSESDRDYALNNDEWSKEKSRPAANQRKNAIIDRVRNSILDLSLLANEEFPEGLLNKAIHNQEEFDVKQNRQSSSQQSASLGIDPEHPHILDSFISAITLIYRMFPPGVANSMVERGVRQAFREFYSDYEVTDADYDPHVQSTSMVHDRAKSNLNDGRQLSEDEIRILLERGEIDPQKVAEHVQKNSEPHETEKK